MRHTAHLFGLLLLIVSASHAESATDARAENPLDWTGLNLLGFALMQVRHELSMGR